MSKQHLIKKAREALGLKPHEVDSLATLPALDAGNLIENKISAGYLNLSDPALLEQALLEIIKNKDQITPAQEHHLDRLLLKVAQKYMIFLKDVKTNDEGAPLLAPLQTVKLFSKRKRNIIIGASTAGCLGVTGIIGLSVYATKKSENNSNNTNPTSPPFSPTPTPTPPPPPYTGSFSQQTFAAPVSYNRTLEIYYKDPAGRVARVSKIIGYGSTDATSTDNMKVTKIKPNQYQYEITGNFSVNGAGTDVVDYTAIPGSDILSQIPVNIQNVTLVLENGQVINNVPVHNAINPIPHDFEMTGSFSTTEATANFPMIPPGTTSLELASSYLTFDINGHLVLTNSPEESAVMSTLDNLCQQSGNKKILAIIPNQYATNNPAIAAADLNAFLAQQNFDELTLDLRNTNLDVSSLMKLIDLPVTVIISPLTLPSKAIIAQADKFIIDSTTPPTPLVAAQQNIGKPPINDPTRNQIGSNTVDDAKTYLINNGFPANKIMTSLSGQGSMMIFNPSVVSNGYGGPVLGVASPVPNTCPEQNVGCPPGVTVTKTTSPNSGNTAWGIGTISGQSAKAAVSYADETVAAYAQTGLRVDHAYDSANLTAYKPGAVKTWEYQQHTETSSANNLQPGNIALAFLIGRGLYDLTQWAFSSSEKEEKMPVLKK